MKKDYADDLYFFDIETTTINNITDVYLASFLHIPFNLDITINEIETAGHTFCRSWFDINSELEKINSIYKKKKQVVICYIHNLAYEFDGLIKNCDFVKNHFEDDNYLFQKTRKPLFVKCDFIEFRCSYILTRKSLSQLGKRYNYPKLEIDYASKYYYFSKLPDVEYCYNKRDVDLTAWAVINTFKAYPYIKKVSDIPLTATALVRMMNKYINDSKTAKSFVKRNEFQRRLSRDYIDWLENVYTGGYTHTSCDYTFKVLKNVCSIDIKSSYPDVMLHRLYPYFFKECKYCKKEFFEFISKTNNITLYDYFNNVKRPFERAYMARIVIKNIVCKKYNNVEVPYISVSKIINEPERCIIDNGRLVATSSDVIIDVTEVDYWLINQFYIFELVDVLHLEYTTSFRTLSNYVTNSVRYFLHIKTELKEAVKKLSNDNNYVFSSDDFSHTYNEKEIKHINNMGTEEKFQFLSNELAVSKENLNSQYGVNVQKLYPDVILYDFDTDDFEIKKSDKLSRSLYRNFEEGLYITAYARLTLFTMFLFLCKSDKNIHPIYSDTDSWKIYHDSGNIELIKNIVNKYNSLVEKSCNNSVDYNVGYFDYEGVYDYFLSWGCKKYITAEKNKIQSTIAGVSKKNFSQALTNIAEKYNNDVEYVFDTLAKCNIIIPYEVTGKLSTKYYNEEFNVQVTDENGDTGIISGHNMVELVNTDYTLLDKRNKLNYNYIKYIESVQGRKIDDSILKITKEGLEWLTDFQENG